MIDFRATYDKDGYIHFCNSYNDTIKTYPTSELKNYVQFNDLNKDILGEFEPVNQYIDREWFEVTEKFYIHENPSEFKSNNTPQHVRRAFV